MRPRHTVDRSPRRCARSTPPPRSMLRAGTLRRLRRRLGPAVSSHRQAVAQRVGAVHPFLAFPPEIRRVVYTTNAIESLNARFRQATRRRGHFPNDQAALKVLYLVIRTPRPNRANVTGKTGGWKAALNALALHYGDRVTEN